MHIFEGTELYPEIQRIVKEVAVKKGEYQSRYDEITKLYEGIKDADIDAEITADLVGDYLFTDRDFISRLSTENRNVFQKVYDEIKYLCKVATAGSKELKELEKAKKLFEKVYREETAKINTADEGGVRYSISNTSKMTLKEQLNLLYKNELKSSDSLYLGITPKSIVSSGLEELPLAFPITNYDKSRTEKHNVPRRSIKSLNENLESALFSFGSDNKIGFVLPDIDADGKPLLVGIEKGVLMDRKPTNVIRSVYGLDNPTEWIENQIKDGKNFVVHNEKEANSFLQTYGYSASVEEGIKLLNDSIPNSAENVKQKDVFGFKINENAEVDEDLLEELSIYDPDAEVDGEGNVTVYHRTSKTNADKIRKTGIMTALEDALFFSSKSEGYASDYGDTVLTFKIPSTVLRVNDIFSGEVHFDVPLKRMNNQWSMNVSKYIVDDGVVENYSLSSKSTTPKQYGNYNVYGEDVMLEGKAKSTGKREITAPTRESIAEGKKKTITDAPIREDLKKKFPMLDDEDMLPIRKDLNPLKSEERETEQILGESQLRTAEPKKNNLRAAWKSFLRNFVSKGAEVETYALKGKNRAVEDKYKMWKDRSEAKAQYFMENGDSTGKSLKERRKPSEREKSLRQ